MFNLYHYPYKETALICPGTSRSPTYNPKKLVEESVGEKKTATNSSHVLDSAKKTVQFNYALVLLITVAGTSFSVLLLVAIGFQLRSRVVLSRRRMTTERNIQKLEIFKEVFQNNIIWKIQICCL